jgi:hypothetical protein
MSVFLHPFLFLVVLGFEFGFMISRHVFYCLSHTSGSVSISCKACVVKMNSWENLSMLGTALLGIIFLVSSFFFQHLEFSSHCPLAFRKTNDSFIRVPLCVTSCLSIAIFKSSCLLLLRIWLQYIYFLFYGITGVCTQSFKLARQAQPFESLC